MSRLLRPVGIPTIIKENGMRATASDDLENHPVVRLLSTYPQYVAKARLWASQVSGPADVPNDGAKWPPRYATEREWVGAFWHWHTMRPWRESEYRIPEEFATIEAWLKYSLEAEYIFV